MSCAHPYIEDGVCRICGRLVAAGGYIPSRRCPGCGRIVKFMGRSCEACAEAISLGASAVDENINQTIQHDDERHAGYCPAVAALEGKSRPSEKIIQQTYYSRVMAIPERKAALKEYKRQYYLKNKEKLLEGCREWRRNHKYEVKIYNACRYAANREYWQARYQKKKTIKQG